MTGKQPKRKPRPNVDEYGRTLLHYAALNGDLVDTRRLLAGGANSSSADDNGWTPLHCAAQEGHCDIARVLLMAGAAVDAQDSHGNTPLFRAVFNSKGRGDFIQLLREHGADPFRQNRHGVSPVSLARTIANFDVAQFFIDVPYP